MIPSIVHGLKPIGVHNYFVYILTNKAKTVLYAGVTNNLGRRLEEHRNASLESFTGKYKCHYLLYYERFQFANDAIAREKEIKGWKRKKKMELIDSFNPHWLFLNNEVND